MSVFEHKFPQYRFVRSSRLLLIGVVDWIFEKIFTARKSRAFPTHIQSILIIKLNNIGDTLAILPVAEELKRFFPAADIDLLIRPTVTGVLEDDDRFRYIWTMNPFEEPRGPEQHVGLWECVRIVRQLRPYRYDVVLELRGDIRCSLLAACLNSKCVVGFGDGGGGWLQHRTGFPPKKQSFLDRDLSILKLIDPIANQAHRLTLRLPLSKKDQTIVKRYLKIKKIDSYCVVHPVAGSSDRYLTITEIRAALRAHPIANESTILIVGTLTEKATLQKIANELNLEWRALPIIVKRIKLLAAVIENTQLMIASASGPMHIAGFLNRPIEAIFKHADRAVWFPYSKLQ